MFVFIAAVVLVLLVFLYVSDMVLKQTREHLSLLYRDVQPIGAIVAFVGEHAPPGYLTRDGGIVDLVQNPQYFALAQVLGSSYGMNGEVRLPDLQGRCMWDKALVID
jgi:hypothetical protein